MAGVTDFSPAPAGEFADVAKQLFSLTHRAVFALSAAVSTSSQRIPCNIVHFKYAVFM